MFQVKTVHKILSDDTRHHIFSQMFANGAGTSNPALQGEEEPRLISRTAGGGGGQNIALQVVFCRGDGISFVRLRQRQRITFV